MDPIIIFENLLMTGLLMCWTFEAIRLREDLFERQVLKAAPLMSYGSFGGQDAQNSLFVALMMIKV
jgi:hypothetical protein